MSSASFAFPTSAGSSIGQITPQVQPVDIPCGSDSTGSELLVSKFQEFVNRNLSLICRDGELGTPLEKLFIWIYDLRDRQCKEATDILEDWGLPRLLVFSHVVDNRILRLRKQLSELQMRMVFWNSSNALPSSN